MPTYFPGGFYYTVKEAAKLKGATRPTIQRWVEKGWITTIWHGGAHHIEERQLIKFTPPKPGRNQKGKNSDV